MANKSNEIETIFVVGCPRSGTTLVGELLGRSRSVYNAKESFMIVRVNKWRTEVYPLRSPITSNFHAQAETLVRQLIVQSTLQAGKSVFVDHTPWHALHIEEIWRMFPYSRIVNVVRHPASVVDSLENSYAAGYLWAGSTTAERVQLWQEFIDATRDASRSGRCKTLRYEDLCADPINAARSLYDWAELSWHDDVLDAFATPHAPNPGRPFALAVKDGGSLRFREPRSVPTNLADYKALESIGRESLTSLGY